MTCRRKILVGDLFLVPQKNGSFTLGQVLRFWPQSEGIATVALFAPEVSGTLQSKSYVECAHNCSATEDLMTVLSTGIGVIAAGEWAYSGSAPVLLTEHVLPEIPFRTNSGVGGIIQSAPLVEALVQAYRGLVPWDKPLPGRPGYLKSLVFEKSVRH